MIYFHINANLDGARSRSCFALFRTYCRRGLITANIIMIMLDCMRTHDLGLSKSCLLLMRWRQQPRICSKIENFQLEMTRLMRTHSKRNIIARKQTAFARLQQRARAPPLVVVVAVYCLHIRRLALAVNQKCFFFVFFFYFFNWINLINFVWNLIFALAKIGCWQ